MLRLTEEMVVFLLEEETGGFIPVSDEAVDLLIIGAILVDLELEHRIKIDIERDDFNLVDRTPLDCALVDPVLEDIVRMNMEFDDMINWQSGRFWVRRLMNRADEIRRQAVDRLTAEGIIRRSDEGGGLLFHDPGDPEDEVHPVLDIRRRVMRVLLENERPTPRDIAIISLCDACGVFDTLLPESRTRGKLRERIKIIDHMDIVDLTVAHIIGVHMQPEVREEKIPVLRGLPVIGSYPEILRDPAGFMVRTYRAHGPVFRQEIMGRNWIFMVGPEANFFFMRKGHLHLSSRGQYSLLQRELETHLFPFGTDGEEHLKLRRAMSDGLSRATVVNANIPQIVDIVRRRVCELPRGRPVGGMRFMQGLISEQLGVLCGKTSPSEYTDDLILFIHTILMRITFREYLFNRLLIPRGFSRARSRTREFIDKVVDEHKHKLDSGSKEAATLIDDLISLHRRDPVFMTEKALEANALVPYLAGLDTASGMCAFILYKVMKYPDLLERARAEADALFAEGTPTAEDLRRMDILPRIGKEVMRMFPPVAAMVREVTNSFTLRGYRFSAGEQLIFPLATPHFMEEFFPDPGRFDIDRYAPGREEHRQLGIYCPFGLGQHRCMGAGIAETMMALTLATMLRYAEMEPERPGRRLRIKKLPTPRPVYRFRVVSLRAG